MSFLQLVGLVFGICSVVLSCCVWVLWALSKARKSDQRCRDLSGRVEEISNSVVKLGDDWDALNEKYILSKNELLACQEELIVNRQEAARFKRLAETHMRTNADFEKERNNAWRLYEASSIMAQNAQVWLLRDLQKALSELNNYRSSEGKTPLQVDRGLEGLIHQFDSEHGVGRVAPGEVST